MNNVWTSIAFRTPCAIRRSARSTPLSQLFNGYVQQQSVGRCASSGAPSLFSRSARRCRETNKTVVSMVKGSRATFSTAHILEAKRKIRAVPASRAKEQAAEPGLDSRLSAAPVVGSHTEGAVAAEDQGLTWRDYDPAGGMPLPGGELTSTEIRTIFNDEKTDADMGNYILSVLHWRRLSGALIDTGIAFPKDIGVRREQALRGLQYLRRAIPDVDESAAGQVWAEEESQRLQEEIQQRAVKLGLYKATEEAVEEEVPPEEQQGTEYGRALTGQSVLQTMRAENEAKWEQFQAEKKAAEERARVAALHSARGPLELGAGVQPPVQPFPSGPGGVAIRGAQTKAWLQPVERKAWVKYYEDQATIIKDNAIPQLGAIQRLLPSFLVLLLVLAGSYYLSENYTPPPRSARIWEDTPPAVATLAALTGVLVVAFLMGRIPPFWRTYNKYMTVVPAYPYALALIGATFRHDTLVHLASNVVTLWLFGLLLHEDVGRGTFLAIYLASGAAGGFASLLYNVARKQWAAYIFGSSGGVLGVVAAACTVRPNGTIKIAGYEIPIAAWVILALFTGGEAIAAIRGLKTTIDHAGHLGGIFAGFAAGMVLRQKAAAASVMQMDDNATVVSSDLTKAI